MAETTDMAPPHPQIKVLRTCAVRPAFPTERQHMFLSNLDLLWFPVNNVRRILFYRNSPTNDYLSVVERLKNSLSSVLVYFYPLAGRLDKGESNRPEINCNDEGVEFIEASIDISFQDLENDGFQRKTFFKNLAKMAHLSEHDNFRAPLLSIQVTALEGGGICIGTTLHHVVADGNSFWHFMKSWAECSRGLPVSNPPQHNRTVFKRENMTPLSVYLRAKEVVTDRINGAQIYKFLPEDSETEKKESIINRDDAKGTWPYNKSEDLVYSTLHFTENNIRDMKKTSGASSLFVAVAAQFWRSVMKARQVPEDKIVHFLVMADCRGRVKPPLPTTYFGNCISLGYTQTTAKKLVNEDVGFAAALIQETVNSCTTEEQINYMIEWLEYPERGILATLDEIGGWRYGTGAVSSPRFPVYEIDHGWGKPVNVQVVDMNEIGAMVIDCASEGGGNIVISTRLPRHQMENLTGLLFGSVN